MSPEYGATCGFFPIDDETLRYLRLTGRSEEPVALVEAYCKENLLWHDPVEPATYSQVVELDLSTVEPSLAGPRRPQDRIALGGREEAFLEALAASGSTTATASTRRSPIRSLRATPLPTPSPVRRADRRTGASVGAGPRCPHGRAASPASSTARPSTSGTAPS